MTLKIGVDANVSGAAKGFKDMDKGARDVAKGVDEIGKSAQKTQQELAKVEQQLKRVHNAQSMLRKEFGTPFVSQAQAEKFLDNADAMMADPHLIGGSRLRKYKSFEDWHDNFHDGFLRRQDADRFRRQVFTHAGGDIFGRPAGSAGGFRGAVSSGLGMAKSFGMGMLAIAGIGGAMGMISRAADLHTEESTGTDTLKRLLGDVNNEFYGLRTGIRAATQGLGIAYVEGTRIAQHFTRLAGGRFSDSALGAEVRTSAGFARAYGIDPMESTTFFGQMRHYKATDTDDKGSRRLAMLIADAIVKGGDPAIGKADKVLEAVSGFAAQVSGASFTKANIGGFASGLGSLLSMNLPGMDPGKAGELLSTVDASIRRGGNMGEGSRNMFYGALAKHYGGGLDPVMGLALLEGGMFGSADSVFGEKTALGRYFGTGGTPKGSESNFSLIMKQLRGMGLNKSLMLQSLHDSFGLSYGAAAALSAMDTGTLDASSNLLGRLGIDASKLSASGMSGFATIAGAKDMSGLRPSLSAMLASSDYSEVEKTRLRELSANTSQEGFKKLQEEMGRLVAAKDQMSTDGTEIRKSIIDLQNVLTSSGALPNMLLTGIRDGVSWLVRGLTPNSPYAKQLEAEEANRKLMVERSAAVMQSDESAPSDVKSKKSAFMQKFGPMVAKRSAELGLDPSMVLGVMAMETDWGTKLKGDNNYWNITNGRGGFVNYKSFDEGFTAFNNLLAVRYKDARWSNGDKTKFAKGLRFGQRGGYDPYNAGAEDSLLNTALSVERVPIPGGGTWGEYFKSMQMSGDLTGSLNIIQNGSVTPAQGSFSLDSNVRMPMAPGVGR